MSNYQEMKEKIRQQAIDWQSDFENQFYSYGEIYEWTEYFHRMGKRYGLLTEFRENGIC